MKKSILIFLTVIVICSCNSYKNYSTEIPAVIIDFDYPVPNGMLVDQSEKEQMIDNKIKHLELLSDTYWGNFSDNEREKLIESFVSIWQFANDKFPAFEGLDINWQEFHDESIEILENTNSYGDYLAIITNIPYILKEGHGFVATWKMYGIDAKNLYHPNVPIFYTLLKPESKIGASCVVTEDGQICVSKITSDINPYNLNPGDVIVGYNGVPWDEWITPLEESMIPKLATPGGHDSSREHSLIRSAIANPNLFETINIKHYGSDEISTYQVVHIDPENYMPSLDIIKEFPEIPEVSENLYGGVIPGTNIGYIRIDEFMDETNEMNRWDPYKTEFSETFERLVASLMDTDGIIIENRQNNGGMPQITYKGLQYLIENDNNEFLFLTSKSRIKNDESLIALEDDNIFGSYPFPQDDEDRFYGKPIVVITGPQAISGGDYFSSFCYDYDEFQLIGSENSGSLSGLISDEPYYVDNGIDNVEFQLTVISLFSPEGENYVRKARLNNYIWHTVDSVAEGIDRPFEEALRIIRE